MELYTKPLCDCGAELLFEVEEIEVVTYKILDHGWIAKRPTEKSMRSRNNYGHLQCKVCMNQYEYNISFTGAHKSKIIRGALIE